jgi:uncharacterized SAM-binding protein YcdF (DUF218 family)
MRKVSKKLVIIIGIFIIILILVSIAVLNVGNWLKGSDTPAPSKAIVVLAGPPSRSFYAADLYAKGYATEVYVSKPVRERELIMLDNLKVFMPKAEDIYKQILMRKGVPEKNIHLLGQSSMSTIDEGKEINREFKKDNCSILIVTSPYHAKRTKMILNKVLTQCDFRVLGTPYEPFPEKWWTNQDSARNVLLEIIKIIFFETGGRFQSSTKDQSSLFNDTFMNVQEETV